MCQTYTFTFEEPVLFKRVYNFQFPDSITNKCWGPADSDEKEIFKYQTKTTVVREMSLRPISSEKAPEDLYYYVMLMGGNSMDSFAIPFYHAGALLKLFGI